MQATISRRSSTLASPRRALCRVPRVRSAVLQRGADAQVECSTSGSGDDNLWWRSLAAMDLQTVRPATTAAMLLMGLAMTAGAASASDLSEPLATMHAQPLAELAEMDFWGNIASYGRYFVTVMLGTGYAMLRPLQGMLKKPVTAVFGIVALVTLVYGTRVALEYMLGINTYDYDPDNYRIYTQY
ncbi:hypothetical protein TSOC_001830 [Tetrabaena socialis]|uniref:Uncharacterized protein ycf33 n=1 Tax=Tetrabaena socialis TaxID=47790 RepID=A0A2J8AFX1_9CHLO|nr:hypothetical protein TSOC_001830 [Tetrabaena socialis]|eukprot:PNH11424.1 hypothetical protein TSOC_001830 [Tetrabaena socialis]